MEAGARIEVDPNKEDPLDFVLWKASKPGEPAWDSPWGPGRPGWHIECSAMSMQYLGETFDLHGGGQDLVFPHHENELAQSEAATGKPFARYWLHHGLLTINAEKMSKSLGNFFTVKEVLARFPAEVVRFFLINCHYRSPLDFSDAALAEAETALLRLYTCLARIQDVLRHYPDLKPQHPVDTYPDNLTLEEFHRFGSLRARFDAAMDDDLNTAQALGYLFETVRLLNRLLEAPSADPGYLTILTEMHEELVDLGAGAESPPGRPGDHGRLPAPESRGPEDHPGRNPTTHRRTHPGPEGQGLGPGRRHPEATAGTGYPPGRYPPRDHLEGERIRFLRGGPGAFS